MEKKSLLKKCPDEDEASSSKSKKDDNNPPRGRPPKSKNSHSAWSFYPGGGKTLFGSFQRVRVEGRRGRGYWEWKAAEHKKNLYDEDDETYVENNSRGKGRVTFQGVDEGKDVARSASADKLKSSPSSRAVPPGGVRVLPSSVSLQEDQLNRKSKNSDLSPVERIKVSSFAQPRLTPMLDRVKPLIEPPSTTPSPPSGIAPTAPPKELLYADSKQRRAARSQPVVGQDHQSLMCQDSSKYPRDKNTQTPTGNVVQGSTKAQVYSDLGLSYPEGYRQYYLNQQSNGKNLEVQDIRGNNESKQSTYTDHSESSLNTSRNDNTLSSIASLSSNKQEPQTKSTPHNSKVNNSSALLRQKQATTDLKRQPPLTDARKSGALVWISQPGGGAKLDWVPTPGLATLRGVPASPLYANVKGRISSQSKQGPIKGEVAASSSSSFPPKGIIKRGDEGGGGGGRGGWGKESPRAGEGKPSSARAADASTNPRVGANGGGISRSSEPSIIFSGDQSKNVLSSAPGVETAGPAGRTCTASSDVTGTNSNIPPDDKGDKIVTVAGRGQGQTVRIRVRPEVHAYLSTLPIISSSLRGPEPPSVATDRDSVYSANSSSGSGLTLGSGEGSIGYQEQGYQEVVDEYTLLKKAVDYHDPEALRLLSAVCSPESGSSEYPYLREMKERLLIAKETPGQEQLLEIHQTPVGTVVKLNADGYHTSPTHRVESLYTGTLESRKTQAHEYFPKNAKTSTFITLSLLYATLCVVVCLGFVLSEVLTHNVPLYYYEAFFTYMYGMSIFFLLYVFCYLLSDSSRDNTTLNNQKVRKPEVLPSDASPTQEKLTASPPKAPKKHKTSENEHSHGSFFLRMGAIAFGLGTMIYNGLEFGIFIEIPMNSPCHQILRGVNPLLQLVFTFMQMYFIFMNARLNIHKFKFLARFGLMHIAAANLCVWIRTLVRESLKEINEFRVTQGHSGEDYMILEGIRRALENRGLMQPNRYMYNLHAFSQITRSNETTAEDAQNETFSGVWATEEDLVNRTCERMEIMGSIVSDSAPYLYPFIVEYSLIAAAVLYIMWKHIGRNPKFVYDAEAADGMSTLSRRCHVKVDCIGASKGLFCGLLVLVATLICLILFFVLINQKDLKMLAIYLADVSHCAIMFFSILAIFIGFCRVRHLKFFGEREEELDDILLFVSAFGLFAYATFSAIAGSLSALTEEPNLLVMSTSILSIIQVLIQMVFIKDTQRRQVALPEQERTKPGRQIVTFLLICNLAMWIIYTFETPKVEANPVQLEFFGKLSWTILLRCTLPLAIFHRFHSSVVLASIWKNSYKTRVE